MRSKQETGWRLIGAVRLSFQFTLSVTPLNFTAIEDLLNLIISSTPEKLSRWPPYFCQEHHAQKSQWPVTALDSCTLPKFPCFCIFPRYFCVTIPRLQSAVLQLKNKFVNWVPLTWYHRDQLGKSPVHSTPDAGVIRTDQAQLPFPLPPHQFFSVADHQLGNQLWRGNCDFLQESPSTS